MEATPPRSQRFASFLDSSPGQTLMHMLDSPANNARRTIAFALELLPAPPPKDLPKLWAELAGHILGPFPAEECQKVNTSGTHERQFGWRLKEISLIGPAWER